MFALVSRAALQERGRQEHIRFWLLHAAQHGPELCCIHPRPAHHHGVQAWAGGSPAIRTGRINCSRGSGHLVAAGGRCHHTA
eukprot:scaffold103101_cov19-Prasinocladus_malaysianus.AAC.1